MHRRYDVCTKYVLVRLGELLLIGGMQDASGVFNGGKDSDWVEKEFAAAQLGDQRLLKRLKQIATDFAGQPAASIPRACGNWARTKGAYRFFDHPEVSAEKILAAHREATVERMKSAPLILAVQDTTSLNYSTHGQTEGLGPISNNRDKTVGLLVHTTLALNAQGLALGVLQTKLWARSAAAYGQNHQRNRKALAEKESQRWLESFAATVALAQRLPQSRVVNISDREGDIYEVFAAARAQDQVGLLVRAQHDRQLAASGQRLWGFVQGQPVQGTLTIQVPAKAGRASRRAELQIRYTAVEIQAPGLKAGRASLKLWAIEARELGLPKSKAICWRLLTNLAVESFQQAVEKLQWYALRWQIEVFHKVLKSGCGVERHQLKTRPRLEAVIALDIIVAWRVMELSRASRNAPTQKALELLSEEECWLLRRYFNKTGDPTALSMREAVRQIAQLGGFLARKNDGEPGPFTLWRGMQRLRDMLAAYELLQNVGKA